MKKFFLILLLFSVCVFAQAVDDACYAPCKQDCITSQTPEDCVKICGAKCARIETGVITKAMTRGEMIQLPPARPVYSCEEKCKIAFADCGEKCRDRLDMCIKYCQPQVAPQLTPPVEMTCERRCWMTQDECRKTGVDDASCKMKIDSCLQGCRPQPPVEMTCERRCWMTQDECKKYNVDDASCKMKIDACLRGCNPQPTCDCPPQPACEYSCETECGVGYHKCKSAGAGNCGKVVVDCLDQCRFVVPPVRCEDQCAKIKQVCRDEGLTDEQCEPRLKECMTRCYPKPMPAVAKSEGPREEIKGPEMPKPGVWSRIKSFFKG